MSHEGHMAVPRARDIMGGGGTGHCVYYMCVHEFMCAYVVELNL